MCLNGYRKTLGFPSLERAVLLGFPAVRIGIRVGAMRGRFRACCIAAGSLVLPLALARAAPTPTLAPVSVDLAIPNAEPTATIDTSTALGFDDFDSAPVIADTGGLQS